MACCSFVSFVGEIWPPGSLLSPAEGGGIDYGRRILSWIHCGGGGNDGGGRVMFQLICNNWRIDGAGLLDAGCCEILAIPAILVD